MRECPACGRAYPEVVGAEEQRCPFCGHETRDAPAPATATRVHREPLADPVGALAHAARFASRHYPRLLLIWLPVLAVDVGLGLAITAYQEKLGLLDTADLSTGDALALLGLAAPLYLLDFAVTFAAWGLVGAHLLDLSRGGGARRAGYRRRLPGALAMGGLLTVALMAGFVLAFVPFLVFLHLFLFAPVAYADGARVGEAFDRSRRFARERETYGFTALVVLLLAGVVAVSFVVGGWLPGWLAMAGITSPYAVAFFEPLPSWLLSPFVASLPASYWVLASQERAAVAPGAARTQPEAHTRSTKCPRCATLIPYEPTGAPVDVRCPKCGASGRVL